MMTAEMGHEGRDWETKTWRQEWGRQDVERRV